MPAKKPVPNPPLPANEPQRLAALHRYGVLDTPPEKAFDELTRLAAQLCGTPISFIAFTDERRQWIKSCFGAQWDQLPREEAISAYAILRDEPFVLEDARQDPRFVNHPMVRGEPHIRFFAGIPILTPEGLALGTLCVLDQSPRTLAADQAEALRILSRQVMTQLELRLRLGELARSVEEHKRTEDRLRNSEAFYQTLVDTLPQNILRKDTQGRFTFANKKFCHSIGKPLHEILGKTDADFFPPELAAKYHRDDQRVMSTLENLDTTEAHITPGGEKLFVHVIKTPLYDALGRVIGIQGIFWDVTQRKKIEEELAYERDLLRALLDNIPDRIYFKDVYSRFLRCSQSLVRRLGVKDTSEVLGKTDFDFHSRELAREFYDDEQRIILTGQPLIHKLERQFSSEGGVIWASVTKVPIYNQNGAITGIIGISRDVTQIKQAEAALEQARDAALESARVKSEFLANMSHEIRTPMNAITGMTGLLLDTPLTQEQRECVETVRDGTETLLGIINDILDFSKIEAGKLSLELIDFELRDAVESTVEMLAEHAQKKGIDLNCWLAADVPNLVRGDPGRFRQVLANLLSNAVKFTEQGEVLVQISKAGETNGRVTLRIEVKDTGVGIMPEARQRIFHAFTQADGSTTRKYGGTGLGLTICKQLVELMGGEIGVESTPGRGSKFWFLLPFGLQAARLPEDEFDPAVFHGLRVLVVDDAKTQCQILREQLQRLKMAVVCPGTEVQVVDFLRTEALAGRPFSLVVSDLDSPVTNGLALARQIKADPAIAAVQVLLLASLGHRLSATAMEKAGVAACLSKPVRQSRLYDCLVDLFSQADHPGAAQAVAPADTLKSGSGARKNARILLAEDNIVNQRVTLRQLRKLGFQADAVANGKEALDALRRVPYDLILMDCQMPELDGYETARHIRHPASEASRPFKSSPYIIALTANALQGDREKCLAAGMNDYLTKPLRLRDLAEVLQRAWARIPGGGRGETSASPDVLDPAVLAGLRELREPGQADPLKELMDLYCRDAGVRLKKLEGAFESNDAAVLAANAHALKGSSNNLGARHLASLCSDLEKYAKRGDFIEAANILLQVKNAYHDVESALLAEMQAQDHPPA